MTMHRAVAFLAMAMVVSSCGPSVQYFPMNRSPHKTMRANIEFFSQPPKREYVELGLIKVKARSKLASSPEEMMRLMRKQAREIGADAVILSGLSSETSVGAFSNPSTGGISLFARTRDAVQGIAIAWKGAP